MRDQTPGNVQTWVGRPALVCLLLALLTLLVFWRTTRCDFLNYDDPDYFTANPHVLSGWSAANIAWAFTTQSASNWHPLTWLSLMLDAQIFGKGPFGPHFTNLLLHTANVVLLFLLLQRMTATLWPSGMVAALFSLHPLHVESVAWVAERKDVLSAFFGLLSLLAYVQYAQAREKNISGISLSFRYSLTVIFFLLGLLAKPMLVTWPFVFLLLDFWPLQRLNRSTIQRLLVEKIPFFALSAASCAVTFIAQKNGGAVAGLATIPMVERIENALVSDALYLEKTFWPVNLANPYPYSGHGNPVLVVFSALLIFGVSLAAISLGRRFFFTGWFWFLGMLVPVIGLVRVGDAAMADRYTYLPLIGVFILLVWSIKELCARQPQFRLPATLLAIAVLAGCGFQTHRQLSYWRNSGTLFQHTLAVTKDNYVACNDFGTWLSANGDVTTAMDYFQKSLEIKPNNPDAFYNLGNAFAKLNDWDGAISNYESALRDSPNPPDILNNLGVAQARQGRLEEAVENFQHALKLAPDSADAHNNLASVLFRQGRFEDAAHQFYEAAKLMPDNPQIFINLGDTFVRLAKTNVAIQCYEQALLLQPDDPKIQGRLRALKAQP